MYAGSVCIIAKGLRLLFLQSKHYLWIKQQNFLILMEWDFYDVFLSLIDKLMQ